MRKRRGRGTSGSRRARSRARGGATLRDRSGARTARAAARRVAQRAHAEQMQALDEGRFEIAARRSGSGATKARSSPRRTIVPSATVAAARATNLFAAKPDRKGNAPAGAAASATRTLASHARGVPSMPRISRNAMPGSASSTSGEAASSASRISSQSARPRAGSSTASAASRAHALACTTVISARAPSA